MVNNFRIFLSIHLIFSSLLCLSHGKLLRQLTTNNIAFITRFHFTPILDISFEYTTLLQYVSYLHAG